MVILPVANLVPNFCIVVDLIPHLGYHHTERLPLHSQTELFAPSMRLSINISIFSLKCCDVFNFFKDLPIPNMREVVSQPVMAWIAGRNCLASSPITDIVFLMSHNLQKVLCCDSPPKKRSFLDGS